MKKNYALIVLTSMAIGYTTNSEAQTVTTLTSVGSSNAITTGKLDTLYVHDESDNTIKKITPTGTVSTFASVSDNIYDMESDTADNIYTVSFFSGTLSKITPAGVISTRLLQV